MKPMFVSRRSGRTRHMRRTAAVVGCLLATVLMALARSARTSPSTTVLRRLFSSAGRVRTKKSPFPTITAALPSARALAATSKVTISVAPGVCDHERCQYSSTSPSSCKGRGRPRWMRGACP